MSKSRGSVQEETIDAEVIVAEQAEVTSSAVEASPVSDEALPYELSSWNGIPRFQCRECAWDTVEGLDHFMTHWRGVHEVLPPPPAPPPLIVTDRFGNPK